MPPTAVARGLHRDRVGREQAVGNRSAIHHRDHPVDGDPRAQGRPVYGLDQWLGQRQPAGFDDDMLRGVVAVEQGFHGRDEIVGNRAAQAAVGQLHDVIIRAAFDAAAAQDFTIDPDVAELVDDQRDTAAASVLQPMPDQAGFAGPEKPGDDGYWHLLSHGPIPSVSAATLPR